MILRVELFGRNSLAVLKFCTFRSLSSARFLLVSIFMIFFITFFLIFYFIGWRSWEGLLYPRVLDIQTNWRFLKFLCGCCVYLLLLSLKVYCWGALSWKSALGTPTSDFVTRYPKLKLDTFSQFRPLFFFFETKKTTEKFNKFVTRDLTATILIQPFKRLLKH